MTDFDQQNWTFTVGATNGFWWNGVWHQVRPSAGDDDGPPTGVREPRRPRPTAPAAGAVAASEEVLVGG